MIIRTSRAVSFLFLTAALGLAGCAGEEPVGNTAMGTVTFKGQPLDQGAIEFTPTAGQGTMSGATIKEGAYALPDTAGLKAGAYKVRITSVEGGAASSDAPPGEPTAAKQRIPAQYNTKSTLTAEVKDGGENKFDFDLK
jgi:hypothetical protein